MAYRLGAPDGGSDSGESENDTDDENGETTPESETSILTVDASTEAEKYAVPFDLDGVANVNSVGEWFSDPLNVEYGRIRLTFKRRERRNPWPIALDYWNAINSEPLWGCLPATVKVDSILPALDLTTGGTRWNVVYNLTYRALGWLEKRADAGFYARDANGFFYRILNADGSPKETPTLLDGKGGVLPAGAEPVFQTFRLNAYRDLNALGLPNPFTI